MTLKIGSRSPKSNHLVPPSQKCIYASLVKIHPSVQKITCGNEATRTQTPTGSAPKTICPPPPFGWGDITKGPIQKPLRITKGNNSNNIGPFPLIFISSICHILMNVFAKFDEILLMILQDIKETKRYGHPIKNHKGK